MPPFNPFIDPETGSLDVDRIRFEATPIAKLIGLFVAIAIVPLSIGFIFAPNPGVGMVFVVTAQFVLAVGAAVTLLYVISRAIQLASG